MECCSVDEELVFKHRGNKLVCLMTIHVDDLKATGEPAEVKHTLAILQGTFGELKITYHTFLNCGVQHTQDPKTQEITLD